MQVARSSYHALLRISESSWNPYNELCDAAIPKNNKSLPPKQLPLEKIYMILPKFKYQVHL